MSGETMAEERTAVEQLLDAISVACQGRNDDGSPAECQRPSTHAAHVFHIAGARCQVWTLCDDHTKRFRAMLATSLARGDRGRCYPHSVEVNPRLTDIHPL